MTDDAVLDQAHDPSHELADAVVQRVFSVINAGLYAPSPEFSSREQTVAYARERSAGGDFGAIMPLTVEVDVCAEYRLRSDRSTQRTVETFTVTA